MQELIPPQSHQESRNSVVDEAEDQQHGAGPDVVQRTTKAPNRGLDVSNRLYALGKLYEAKKDILRERQSIMKKEEEERIIKMGKMKHSSVSHRMRQGSGASTINLRRPSSNQELTAGAPGTSSMQMMPTASAGDLTGPSAQWRYQLGMWEQNGDQADGPQSESKQCNWRTQGNLTSRDADGLKVEDRLIQYS